MTKSNKAFLGNTLRLIFIPIFLIVSLVFFQNCASPPVAINRVPPDCLKVEDFRNAGFSEIPIGYISDDAEYVLAVANADEGRYVNEYIMRINRGEIEVRNGFNCCPRLATGQPINCGP